MAQSKRMQRDSEVIGRSAQQQSVPSEMYHVSKTEVGSKKARAAALAEFQAITDDNLVSSYVAWGNHAVVYSEIDQQSQLRRLKTCNDAYTMSMIMSCAKPLGSGVTPSSLIQVWTSYRLIMSLNPNMDMDVSRMMSNLSAEVKPIYEQVKRTNPMLAMMLRPLTKELDKYGVTIAGDKMKSAIRQSFDANSLDSMVMTPKQVAALKVGFMEQYYRDLRSGSESQSFYTRRYNTAVEHLKNIATNSGFDMSVVAAEERHIVGIKMMHNPYYANVFNETYGLYGVTPQLEKSEFADAFGTRDGHNYYMADDKYGAFTVRLPMNSSSTMYSDYTKMLITNADQLSAMQIWLDSDNCLLSKGDVDTVRKSIESVKDRYADLMHDMMVDDGVGQRKKTEKSPDELMDTFERQYETMCEIPTAGAYPAFHMEVDRIVYKDILMRSHALEPDPNDEKLKATLQKLLSFDQKDAPIPELDVIVKYEQKRCEEHGVVSTRSIRTIMDDMRLNYLESLSAEDTMELLMHAGNNLQQSLREPDRQSYYRPGYTYNPEEDIGQAIADAEAAEEEAAKRAAESPATADAETEEKTAVDDSPVSHKGSSATTSELHHLRRSRSGRAGSHMHDAYRSQAKTGPSPIQKGRDVPGPSDDEMDALLGYDEDASSPEDQDDTEMPM